MTSDDRIKAKIKAIDRIRNVELPALENEQHKLVEEGQKLGLNLPAIWRVVSKMQKGEASTINEAGKVYHDAVNQEAAIKGGMTQAEYDRLPQDEAEPWMQR